MQEHALKENAVQSSAELYKSELQFRRLLEKLPAGAYTCDAQCLITYYNPHAVTLWGRAPKLNDPVDRFCGSFKLYAAADGSPINHDSCWMALALQTGKEYNGHEIIIERPDRSRVTALAHANPFHDESGKLLGAVNVLVDISERKRAEDASKEADRSKNEFLATLVQELRHPLAPIRNAAQILRHKAGRSPESQWALDVVDRQMNKMTRLIDDLLDIAQINKLELRKERVDLTEIVNMAVESSRPLIEACGHECKVTLPPQRIALDGDRNRLAQVISNLLNNAAKYTERGGSIALTAEREGNEAVIVVRDTGIGIPVEMLPRIFKLFTRVERSLDRTHGGLGLGLARVKQLVEIHGGTITAHSDGPDKGSEFALRLPVAAEPALHPVPRQ